MLGRADEIKTASISVFGDIKEPINEWLEKNSHLEIIEIKISGTEVLFIYRDENCTTIARPEVSK